MIYKGYILKQYEPFPTLTQIAVEGRGGSVPTVLTSLFTTPARAIEAIDDYLVKRDTQEVKSVRKTNPKN